jgi:hypothetical protein
LLKVVCTINSITDAIIAEVIIIAMKEINAPRANSAVSLRLRPSITTPP